ncbi:MAG TPA: PhoPQ-activated pathogenicity-related family protein [Gemmataceae bacterium]|nr:PhoPQ-activated pathogenicity-related family protein [Gemmataceae bacterium]
MLQRRIVRPAFLLVICFCLTEALRAGETALDRYVAKPDPTYSWKVVHETAGNPRTQYTIDLKSQTWRTNHDVDRTVWQHWLTVIKPDKPVSNAAFLFLANGTNKDKPPTSVDPLVRRIAEATNSVVAELKMVPNQPLIFHNDGVSRKEDDLIGYTWDQYLKTGDETWPARLPMTKSAVRAMDCIQAFLASARGGRVKIDRFVVAGDSKRGWTTWCTAAVDKRVAAAVPTVIDVVNVPASMQHHVAAYGFYARSLDDYMKHNILQRSHAPKLKDLYAIEDPYSYLDRVTMPKFIINASGDELFCPDSSQFYYNDLKGEKYLRYVPNADHSLENTDAIESTLAFYWTVLTGKSRPRYSWTFEADGSIRVQTPDKPKQVVLWQAHNPSARDFRVESIGTAYKSSVLHDQGNSVYIGKVDQPAKGWTAFFVELTFDIGAPTPLKLTSAVRVLPDRLPFADIDPAKAPYEGLKPRAGK